MSPTVTPVFNDGIGAMSEQLISIFPGTYHPSEVGITVRQNGQLQLNRMVQICNGINNSTFFKG